MKTTKVKVPKKIKPPTPPKQLKPKPMKRTISSRTGALGATSGY